MKSFTTWFLHTMEDWFTGASSIWSWLNNTKVLGMPVIGIFGIGFITTILIIVLLKAVLK